MYELQFFLVVFFLYIIVIIIIAIQYVVQRVPELVMHTWTVLKCPLVHYGRDPRISFDREGRAQEGRLSQLVAHMDRPSRRVLAGLARCYPMPER